MYSASQLSRFQAYRQVARLFFRWGSAMNSTNEELSTILNQIIDKAADNLRIAKIIIQLGLDPDHITYDAIFNRLLEIFLANITIANICALVGATFFVATLLTRTMVPLRVSNMISNVFFMAFALSLAISEPFLSLFCCFLSMPYAFVRCLTSSEGPQCRAWRDVDGMAQAVYDPA
jgi:hypothetical protein